MARTAKPELDKLKEKVQTLTVPELEILIGYAEAVLDTREALAVQKVAAEIKP